MHKTVSDQTRDGKKSILDLLRARYAKPCTSSKLVAKAHDHIVASILKRQLAPGQRIVEAQIAEALGMSTIPVREALARLEHEGMVQRIPSRGAFVRRYVASEVRQLFEVREILETGVIEQVVKRISDDEVLELGALVRFLEEHSEADDWEIRYEADMLFHRLIVRCAGSPKLDELYDSVLTQIQSNSMLLRNEILSLLDVIRRRLSRADHGQIFEAIQARDAKAAEQMIRAHTRIACESGIKSHELLDTIEQLS